MSGEALGWAKRQSAPTRGCKSLLICLADYANRDGFAWPSLASMADETQMAERHIRRSLVLLCRAGLLQAYEVHDAGNGRSRPRLYWFPIRASEPAQEQLDAWRTMAGASLRRIDPEAEGEGRGRRATGHGEEDMMSPSQEDSRVRGEEDLGVRGRGTLESSLEPDSNPKRSEDLFQSAHAVARDPFGEALAIWPESGRKVTDDGVGREQWAVAVREVGTDERLLAAVAAYVADPAEKARTWRPALHNWLRQKRYRVWLGEAVAAPAAAVAAIRSGRFPDAAIRAALVELLGEAAVLSYLDPCGWDPEGRRVLARSVTGAERLRTQARALVAALGLTVVDPAPRSIP